MAANTARSVFIPLPSMGHDYLALLQALVRICTSVDAHDVKSATAIDLTRSVLVNAGKFLVEDIVSAQTLYPDFYFSQHVRSAAASGTCTTEEQALDVLAKLAQAETTGNAMTSAVTSVLFTATQIANYALYANQYESPVVGLQGSSQASSLLATGACLPFCGGALGAYAIAQKDKAESEDVGPSLKLSIDACRMAFWMGLSSDRVAARYLQERHQVKNCSERFECGSWCLVVIGWSQEQVEQALDQISKQGKTHLYLSALTSPTVISVSGPPFALDCLQVYISKQGGARTVRAPVYSPFHSSQFMQLAADEFERLCDDKALGRTASRPWLAIYSSVSGTQDQEACNSPKGLADLICRYPAGYADMVDNVVREALQLVAENPARIITVLNVGPGGGLGSSLAKRLVSAGISTSRVELVDLEQTITRAESIERPLRLSESREPLAIVGQAFRLPGNCSDRASLQNLLQRPLANLITKLPEERFKIDDYTNEALPDLPRSLSESSTYGAFLSDVDLFDATFFNISPREAEQMDPQHRLFLLTAHEALEAAGYAPDKTPSFQRDLVGTFYAGSHDDYRDNASADIGAYLITGNGRAFASGRVSFVKDLGGSSATVDAGEASFFAAIQTAADHLRRRQIETAVVGTSCVFTSPPNWIGLDRAGMLGRLGPAATQKPFDLESDGTSRAEACYSLVLKRLSQAEAEGDPIIALIPSVEATFSTPVSSTLKGMNQPSLVGSEEPKQCREPQVRSRALAIQRALQKANLSANEVDLIECNASGYAEDETVELEAIHSAFSATRSRDSKKIYLGSVKAIFGCAEGASGALALAKALECIQTNARFPEKAPLKPMPALSVLKDANIWLGGTEHTKEAGVNVVLINSYSLGGANNSMVLQRYKPPKTISRGELANPSPDARGSFVVGLAAKSAASLQRQASKWHSFLLDLEESTRPTLRALSHVSMARRNTNLPFRATALIKSHAELFTFLKAVETDSQPIAPVGISSSRSSTAEVAFFFSGQGSQYEGMARKLACVSSRFRATLEQCESLCTAELGFPGFLHALLEHEGSSQLDAATTQYAIFSIEYALADLLSSYGVVPVLVAGHSLGEYAALAVSGVLSLRDAFFCVATRAQLLLRHIKPGQASMLAVVAEAERCQRFLQDTAFHLTCELACENAPQSTVISGPVKDLESLATHMKASGIKCTVLGVPFAFHSKWIEPILSPFKQAIQEITFQTPRIPVLSNVTGEVVETAGVFGPSYLTRHSRERVRFLKSIQSLQADSRFSRLAIALELGPHAVVLPMIKSSAELVATTLATKEATTSVKPPRSTLLSTLLPVMKKGAEDLDILQGTLRQLYGLGTNVDWFQVDADLSSELPAPRCFLPPYSFDLKRYWLPYRDRGLIPPGTAVLTRSSTNKQHKDARQPPQLRSFTLLRQEECTVESSSEVVTLSYKVSQGAAWERLCEGHRVFDLALVPLALSAELHFEGARLALDAVQTQIAPGASREAQPVELQMSNLHVAAPLIRSKAEKGTEPLEVFVRCTVDRVGGNHLTISCMLFSAARGSEGKSTLHSTSLVSVVNSEKQQASLQQLQTSNYASIQAEMEHLTCTVSKGLAQADEHVDVLDPQLSYRLFSRVVCYTSFYQAAKRSYLSKWSGISIVSLSGNGALDEDSDLCELRRGKFYFNPLGLDAVGQITGLVANTYWAPADGQSVYVIEACQFVCLSSQLRSWMTPGTQAEVYVLAIVRPPSEPSDELPAEIVSDAYILQHDATTNHHILLGCILGQRYRRFRAQSLASILHTTAQAQLRSVPHS